MARGLFSTSKATCLALLLGSALALPEQEAVCDAQTERCPPAADELDEASLLVRGAVIKERDHAAAAAEEVAGAPAPACAEGKFQGLCYRSCTNMGGMEPRRSPSNCGGETNYTYIASCAEDGGVLQGSGSAPGLGGRKMSSCFPISGTVGFPKVVCTQDCKASAPSTTVQGCPKKWCCSDGESQAQASKVDGNIVCSCPSGKKPPFKWLPKPSNMITTASVKPCNAICVKAKAWLQFDGMSYCCPKNTRPTVTKEKAAMGDYSVKCTC